jgi:ribosomal protein S18 acetylase RimI-like enzyme
MWTAPEARRHRIASALVDAVVEFAAGAGAERMELWVTRGNEPALRLYERCGFTLTSDHQPLPSDPCKDEVRMVRPLTQVPR